MRFTFLTLATAAALIAPAVHAQPATYAVDPTHTFATFEISHFGASVNRGRFDKKEGAVQFDKAGKTGKVELTLHINSINTGTPSFDKHLQSADIFDAAKFPTAHFVGDKFNYEGDKLVSVAGNMTIKGKTQPVTFKANQFACYDSPMLKREVCGGDFETTIQRSQWGVNWGLQMGVADATKLIIQVEAVKQ